MSRKGIGGKPVGPGVHGREQKFCTTAFKNTMNKDTPLNKEHVLNTEFVMNTPKEGVFESTDDILRILRTHPDFLQATKRDLEPLVKALFAGLLSVSMVTSGNALLFLSGGTTIGPTALLLKCLGSTMTAAGTAGTINAIKDGFKGTFSWHNWGEDVVTSAAVTFFTLAPTTFAGYGFSRSGFSYLASEATATRTVACQHIKNMQTLIRGATAVVHSILQTSAYAVMNQKLDPITLVLTLVNAAYSGYAIGDDISTQVLQPVLTEKLQKILKYADELADRKQRRILEVLKDNPEFQTIVTRIEENTAQYTSLCTINSYDWIDKVQKGIACGTIENDPNTLMVLLTGTHGWPKDSSSSLTALTRASNRDRNFFRADENWIELLTFQRGGIQIGPWKMKFKLLDVAEFKGRENALAEEITSGKPKHCILAFCFSNNSDVHRLVSDTPVPLDYYNN